MEDTTVADTKFARDAWIRALERTARIEAEPYLTLPMLVQRLASEQGEAPALIARDRSFSYAALAARALQYARWAHGRGLGAGEVVALLMENCAEYVAV